MEADWTDLKVEYLERVQPKYKRVDLDEFIKNYVDEAVVYEFKTKYGDLYVEVK